MDGLRGLLKEKDPESYNKIDTGNHRRLIRAREVTLETGTPYSSRLGRKKNDFPWNFLIAGIALERDALYQRINERTAVMIRDGLKDETNSLLNFRHMKSLQTVGYREMFEHLDGKLTLEETEQKIAQNTRNYAKRQLTWFKKYENMIWIRPGEEDQLIRLIEEKRNKS